MLGHTISHYRITGKLGSGGMGIVYEAEDVRLPRKVALKFLPEESADDPDAERRFQREADTIAQLNHPNICTIYEIDHHERRAFIAMECVEGLNLKTYMARRELSTTAHRGDLHADRSGSRLGSRQGDRPPRHQAREHHRERRGPGEGARLRPGATFQDDRNRPRPRRIHDAGATDGHGQLHGAGADPAASARPAQRPLLSGSGHVRDGNGEAAVCRQPPRPKPSPTCSIWIQCR